jgi:hypothetical protein
MTTLSRGAPRTRSQRPRSSSLRPCVSLRCGTGYLTSQVCTETEAEQFLGKRRGKRGMQMKAYISAESKKLMPASKAVSRRRSELAAPFCSPIVIVPAWTQYARAESASAEPQRERERVEGGTEAEAGNGRQVGSELEGRHGHLFIPCLFLCFCSIPSPSCTVQVRGNETTPLSVRTWVLHQDSWGSVLWDSRGASGLVSLIRRRQWLPGALNLAATPQKRVAPGLVKSFGKLITH